MNSRICQTQNYVPVLSVIRDMFDIRFFNIAILSFSKSTDG